jgi:hypothetical protein
VIRRAAVVPLLPLLLLGAAAARSAVVPPAPATLAEHVATLAAPEMEGRRSGTPGGDRAAARLAAWLAAAGLRPGGDHGTFLQPFVVDSAARLGPASALELVGPAARRLALGREWTPHGGSLTGEVEGEVVFVGHGAAIPDAGWDDYAGVDVRGKIAVALDGTPRELAGERVSRLDKLLAARRRGAAALLLVADTLPSLAATPAQVGIVSAAITREAARDLGPGDRVRLRVDLARDERQAANVVGILPGTDPARASEAVVIGAHYDHLGLVNGDVHPGADDNASGSALVIGLARAFAASGGADRTLVFVLFGGEELGLLGSRHYVRQPAVPLAGTVAMVNFDMVGRMKNRKFAVGGGDSGSGLRDVLTAAAQAGGAAFEVKGTPYQSSDHSRFYEAGVPVLFFTTGGHPDYHKPTDTADKIDADGMAEVARVATRAIERLASDARPVYAKVAPPALPSRDGAQGSAASVAFLGIVVDGRGAVDGLRLSGVLPASAAAAAGLREDDVIVRIAGTGIDSFEDLRRVLRGHKPGDAVRLVYLRDGEAHTTAVTLGARP